MQQKYDEAEIATLEKVHEAIQKSIEKYEQFLKEVNEGHEHLRDQAPLFEQDSVE